MKTKQNILNNNYVIIYAALFKNLIVFLYFKELFALVTLIKVNMQWYETVLPKKITSFVDLNFEHAVIMICSILYFLFWRF